MTIPSDGRFSGSMNSKGMPCIQKLAYDLGKMNSDIPPNIALPSTDVWFPLPLPGWSCKHGMCKGLQMNHRKMSRSSGNGPMVSMQYWFVAYTPD
ncbi:hypothetical protein PAXRUDRAFT_835086 [Paxillus rubicundulus Ve08.2h10]|uniref:Uncharacterized protein n=1 Tax=Paxillus rubicundulus Ve08.2h10 TaxID=930991 RepID=A0A0D0D0R3_9AGAM|nr:hypothetical protein PAXRUDRAFT_835086 [Paxillus rubicundulus Ve08.2h10]